MYLMWRSRAWTIHPSSVGYSHPIISESCESCDSCQVISPGVLRISNSAKQNSTHSKKSSTRNLQRHHQLYIQIGNSTVLKLARAHPHRPRSKGYQLKPRQSAHLQAFRNHSNNTYRKG